MIPPTTSYWFIVGAIYLGILTYQDYKRKMIVDGRYNYFMMGLTFSLLSHFRRGLLYILALLVLTILLGIVIKKLKILGQADINAITWIYYGMGIINPFNLVVFFAVFSFCILIYFVTKIMICRLRNIDVKEPVAFFPVILVSYIVSLLALVRV